MTPARGVAAALASMPIQATAAFALFPASHHHEASASPNTDEKNPAAGIHLHGHASEPRHGGTPNLSSALQSVSPVEPTRR